MVSSRQLKYNIISLTFVLALATLFIYSAYNFLKANLVIQYGIVLVIGLLALLTFLKLKNTRNWSGPL